MPRTRSRQKTEEKFQQAVLDLVAEAGCAALGINAVAKKAGADKVLIYRYFGDLNGLLRRVAESRRWLPTADELVAALPENLASGTHRLREIHRLVAHLIHAHPTTHQLVRWRKAEKNALTEHFSDQWHRLWRELPERLGNGLDYDARHAWKHSCALLALIIEAELCEESVQPQCLDHLGKLLELGQLPKSSEAWVDVPALEDADCLPTNLL